MTWSVYMIEASDGSLYTGITTDVERRFLEHQGSSRGARFFRGRRPEAVVYLETGHDRASASRREAEIKAMPRRLKEELKTREAFTPTDCQSGKERSPERATPDG